MTDQPRMQPPSAGGRPADRPVRRPYRRPELVAYGALAKLTRGARSGSNEVTPQGAMKMCL
jgi:hypothetical protein